MTKQEALFKYNLWLGDNALILGHRVSEWTSNAPILEEDLALSNIALDFLGQANAFLKYAAEVEAKGRTEDDLAFKRGERHFYNNLIMELPKGDFAFTIARQFIVSHYLFQLYTKLNSSKDETIAALAAKSLKEIKYHQRHSNEWVLRLGDGTAESKEKMQNALNEIWMYTGDLFAMDESDSILIKEGVAIDLSGIKADWDSAINEVLLRATLQKPADGYMQSGSRKGLHTEYLGFLLTDMQYLQRAYPDAKW